MKLRSILAGTAIASLALFGTAGNSLGIAFTSQAEAAVSISFSVFYDDLAPHGDWVRYHDAYVFIPTDVDADWRPYTEGHWVHTKRYGWTWISDEPFGWATYHYGRWGYGDDIGWYWVPGKRWAPAWVSWRRSNDYIVWAPLPPSRDDADVSISISIGDIPDFYWVAVPARQFLAPDIHVAVLREDREIRRVIDRTEYVGAPRITNNIVINNVIDVNVVQQVTGQEVRSIELRETDDPRKATVKGDQVTIFQGDVTADGNAKPKKVREVSAVKKVKRGTVEGDTTGTAPAAGDEAPETGTTTTETAPAEKKPEKKAKGEVSTDQSAPADQSATPEPDTGKTTKKLEKKAKGETTTDQNAPADQAATPEPDTGKATKKKVKGNAAKKQDEPDDTAEKPATPKEKPAAKAEGQQPDAVPQEDVTGTTEPAPKGKEKAQGKKKDKQPSECDTEADPNCKSQQ